MYNACERGGTPVVCQYVIIYLISPMSLVLVILAGHVKFLETFGCYFWEYFVISSNISGSWAKNTLLYSYPIRKYMCVCECSTSSGAR